MSCMFIRRSIRKSDNIEARGGKLFGKLYFRERRKGLKKGFEKSSFEVLVDKMLCSGLDNSYVKSLYNEKDEVDLHTTYKAITASYLGGRQIKEVFNITVW